MAVELPMPTDREIFLWCLEELGHAVDALDGEGLAAVEQSACHALSALGGLMGVW